MKIFGYEITFDLTVKDLNTKGNRKKGFSSKTWNTSEKNHLLKRHGEGMPVKDIAKELNRTAPAITAMVYKLHRNKKK